MAGIIWSKAQSALWHVERCTAYVRWRYGPVHDNGRRHGLDKPIILSLTSFPQRFATLSLTLKCLLSQSMKPDEVVLWIAHEDHAQLPDSVLSLQKHGLSIRFCDDTKSFKKIIPTIESYPGCHIVTADDDVYYRHTWLEELVSAWSGNDREVVCHRAHKISLGPGGLPLPYEKWEFETKSLQRSSLIFPTGVDGVLYPTGVFDPRVIDKALFTNLCPTADDIWLYWMVRLHGGTARSLGKWRPMCWPGSQTVGLVYENVHLGNRNDNSLTQMIKHFGFPQPDDSIPSQAVTRQNELQRAFAHRHTQDILLQPESERGTM